MSWRRSKVWTEGSEGGKAFLAERRESLKMERGEVGDLFGDNRLAALGHEAHVWM